jgi:hypothetical protein
MAAGLQITFDASDPARLGAFWAERLGATFTRVGQQRGEFWVVMQDPDGNELCLQ